MTVGVVDFGGQYTLLIAQMVQKLERRVRIVEPDEDLAGFDALIFSGGPASVFDESSPKIPKEIYKKGIPILGICYGLQLITHQLGGEVIPQKSGEYSKTTIKISGQEGILQGLRDQETVWMSHGDRVVKTPKGFQITASSKDCPVAATENQKKKIFGVQFHPEVSHTPCGERIIENFLQIAGIPRDFTAKNFVEETVEKIKERVGNGKVFLLLSGGGDSTLVLALLNLALNPEQIYPFHIDTGLNPEDEAERVKHTFGGEKLKELKKWWEQGRIPEDVYFASQESYQKIYSPNLQVFDASSSFIRELKKVYDPETKRRIVGRLFVALSRFLRKELSLLMPDDNNATHWLIAQGTLYPDTIESARTRYADRIKSHHNLDPEMRKENLLEPLEFLFKDDVRIAGEELGLPSEVIKRWPFPGPGNSIRTICSEKNEKILFFNVLKGYCAYLLPIRSVGVQGDHRTYAESLILDGPISWGWERLDQVSRMTTNTFQGKINRVIYFTGGKANYDDLRKFPLQDLKLKKESITKSSLQLLQKCEALARKRIKAANWYPMIWQMPVILVPLSFSGKGWSVILRPVNSINAMTADFHKLPMTLLKNICDELLKIKGIEAVFYDVTNKPPGTIEWE